MHDQNLQESAKLVNNISKKASLWRLFKLSHISKKDGTFRTSYTLLNRDLVFGIRAFGATKFMLEEIRDRHW